MIGFPYFLLCYHGIANVNEQTSGGGQGGGGDDPDCSGHGETWGPGIGPPPEGCGGGPQSTQGYSYNSQSSQSVKNNEISNNFNYLILFSIGIVTFLFSKSLYYFRTDNTDSVIS